MAAREYRTIDKSAWGEGPWQDEPDKRSWTDEATGLPCLIVRQESGHLCGYVGVLPGHPLHGRDCDVNAYDDDGNERILSEAEAALYNVDVHGGLTYAAGCQHGDDESIGVCHVPEAGQPDDVWWFGFDCAHSSDYSPGRAARLGERYHQIGEDYRTVGYVSDQVAGLARQLATLAREG